MGLEAFSPDGTRRQTPRTTRSPTDTDRCPPIAIAGNDNCPLFLVGELFDIVIVDEGTCGRRPWVLQL